MQTGPGRHGDAMTVHRGRRRALDHLLMLLMPALMLPLALSALGLLLRLCWWAALASFPAIYPIVATG